MSTAGGCPRDFPRKSPSSLRRRFNKEVTSKAILAGEPHEHLRKIPETTGYLMPHVSSSLAPSALSEVPSSGLWGFAPWREVGGKCVCFCDSVQVRLPGFSPGEDLGSPPPLRRTSRQGWRGRADLWTGGFHSVELSFKLINLFFLLVGG